jgi:hypothetical protein
VNPDIARQVAQDPVPHSRAVLALALDVLLREVETTESQLAEERRLKTLGGVPPGYHLPGAWKNRTDSNALHPDYRHLAGES